MQKPSSAALPIGRSIDSQAGRLLTVSMQQAVAAAELAASDPTGLDDRRREGLVSLSNASHELAAALAGRRGVPPPKPLDELARTARFDRDTAVPVLAESLAGASHAVAVLQGQSDQLPTDLLAELPGPLNRLRGSLTPDDPAFRRAVHLAAAAGLAGLIAGLAGLGRPYGAVFAAVVVLNAPAAQDWKRAVMRIAA